MERLCEQLAELTEAKEALARAKAADYPDESTLFDKLFAEK